jgi:hypothetical protein
MRRNIDVLMDRVPADAGERRAPRSPACGLLFSSAGCGCARQVVATSRTSSSASRRTWRWARARAADAVEEAVHRALPESDVVVHVEPGEVEAALRERVHAAALTVPRVREVHNLRLVAVDGGVQVALHLKLPGELSLEDAHDVASQVELAIGRSVPEVLSVQTHLEPLREPGKGRTPEDSTSSATLWSWSESSASKPRLAASVPPIEDGLSPSSPCSILLGAADAHAASEVEARPPCPSSPTLACTPSHETRHVQPRAEPERGWPGRVEAIASSNSRRRRSSPLHGRRQGEGACEAS